MTLHEENAVLRAEVTELREQVRTLLAEVENHKGRLSKDSHNSSKPPSSDGLARKTKSLRPKSGKRAGGQPGHPGHWVSLVATPDHIETHRPIHCGSCQQELPAEALGWIERRQVQDLPALRLVVTEHRLLHVRWPACGATTVADPPAGVAAPRQYGPRLQAVGAYM